MSENLKKFLEEASKNEELRAKLEALTDKSSVEEKAIEIAKEYGFTLSAEDFKTAEAYDLSQDELNQVAGGGCTSTGMNDGANCICTEAGIGRHSKREYMGNCQ